MTKEELDKIIENHQHWLKRDCDGYGKLWADLSGANLSGVDLSGVDLSRASLDRVDLSGANLSGANLYMASLKGAYLHRVDLSGANLSGANLYMANLFGANLYRANLSGANLYRADLAVTNLYRADLSEAYMRRVDLRGASLNNTKNAPFIPYACPEFGSFVGFKKAGGCIVMLEIPEDAKRLSATSLKCRCNKAKVLEIQNIDGSTSEINEVRSNYDKNFIYKVGEIVSVDDFDENRWNECSTGIHFFINRQSAVEYY